MLSEELWLITLKSNPKSRSFPPPLACSVWVHKKGGNPAPHSWGEHTASSERCQLLRPPGLLCSARSKRCVSKKACQQPACSSLLAAGPQGTELNQSIISTRVPGAAQLSHAQHGTEYFQVLQLVIFFYCSL